MQIRMRTNSAIAEVDDELGKQLIESGLWEAATDSPARKTRRHPKPESAEEAQDEE